MSDPTSARLLTHKITALLHEAGMYYIRTSDMRYVADLIESRGEKVNLTFVPELNHGAAESFVIFNADQRFVGTISWRVIETDDYVGRMKSGTEWAPDADALGWETWPIVDAPIIAGRVHDRGGIFVEQAFRSRYRMSWYLTSLHLALMVEIGGDFVVSHALPKVSRGKLPRDVYGYDHVDEMPEHKFPWYRHPFVNALVWSDSHSVREQVARRLRFLRQYDGQDLGETARAFERYQKAIERSADAVWPSAVDKRRPRLARQASG